METITWTVSIQKILDDNRKWFCKQYGHQTRKICFKTVNTVLQCGTWSMGYATHICTDCGDTKKVAFTCKSRFCNSCGKPASDKRFSNLVSWRPDGVNYYHLAFTIPEELRPFFKRHRAALKLLPQVASQAVRYYFQQQHKAIPWILAVIHTFGAQLNWNPHTHLIITDGWFTPHYTYKRTGFIPYKLILASWKWQLLKTIKQWSYDNLQNPNKEVKLINYLYQQKDSNDEEKSWYIYFSPKVESFKVVFSYIGRYLKRPVIGQSRILHYDGDNVTYYYRDKYDNQIKIHTVTAIEFIWLLIQHIPPKSFPMVYYYGIFANSRKKIFLLLLYQIVGRWPLQTCVAKNMRERMLRYCWVDLSSCSCGWSYVLWSLHIPWYPTKYFREPD